MNENFLAHLLQRFLGDKDRVCKSLRFLDQDSVQCMETFVARPDLSASADFINKFDEEYLETKVTNHKLHIQWLYNYVYTSRKTQRMKETLNLYKMAKEELTGITHPHDRMNRICKQFYN